MIDGKLTFWFLSYLTTNKSVHSGHLILFTRLKIWWILLQCLPVIYFYEHHTTQITIYCLDVSTSMKQLNGLICSIRLVTYPKPQSYCRHFFSFCFVLVLITLIDPESFTSNRYLFQLRVRPLVSHAHINSDWIKLNIITIYISRYIMKYYQANFELK